MVLKVLIDVCFICALELLFKIYLDYNREKMSVEKNFFTIGSPDKLIAFLKIKNKNLFFGNPQQIFSWLKLTIETLEKDVKYIQS